MSLDLNQSIDLKNVGKKKAPRVSTKRGINLARDEEKRARQLTALLIALGVIVVLLLIAKFGVLDLIEKRDAAQKEYESVHEQAVGVQNELQDYDKVLLEYRAYSRDWMEKDNTGKYVSVNRSKVLDLVEEKIMTKGTVRSVTITEDLVKVEMIGMNLTEISEMCASIEESPFVSYASLQTAHLNEEVPTVTAAESDGETDGETASEEGTKNSEQLSFLILIRLQPETKEG